MDYPEVDGNDSGTRRLPKKRRVSESIPVKHHPLFDSVETAGDKAELPTIHTLNDDCLEFILSFFNTVQLFKLALVCRRWYNLSISKISRMSYLDFGMLHYQLHKELPILQHSPPSAKTENILQLITKSVLSLSSGSLKSLCLFSWYRGCDLDYEYLGNFVSNVTELEINEYCPVDVDLQNFIKYKLGANLKCFKISVRCLPSNRGGILSRILSETKTLEHFSISGSWSNLSKYSEPYLNSMYDAPLAVSKSNPVRSFTLQGLPKSAKSRALEYVIRNFSNSLEYLNLSYPCSLLEGFKMISPEPLPTLYKVKIFSSSGRPYSDQSKSRVTRVQLINQLLDVLKLMPNLRVLDLNQNNLTIAGVEIIDFLTKHCPLLEELHLSNCWILAEKLAGLQKLKFIKRLRLDLDRYGAEVKSLPEHRLTASFTTLVSIIPLLEELEYLKLDYYHYEPRVIDVFDFLKNAGPQFKGFAITIRPEYLLREVNPGINFMEEALKALREHPRAHRNHIHIIVTGLYRQSCASCRKTGHYKTTSCDEAPSSLGTDCYTFYNDLAPEYIRINPHIIVGRPSFHENLAIYGYKASLNKRIARNYIQVPNIAV